MEAVLLARTRGKRQAWKHARRQDFLLEQGVRGKHGSRHGGSAACLNKGQEASMEAGTEAGLLAKTRGKRQAWE